MLLHEEEAIDASRDLSVLLNHDANSILGTFTGLRVDDDRVLRGTVTLDDDEDGNRAMGKVHSGSLRGVSIRSAISGIERVEAGEEWKSPGGRKFEGPVIVARSWQPIEVSLTPIPADQSAGVGRTLDTTEDETMPQWLLERAWSLGLARDASEEEAQAFVANLLQRDGGDANDDGSTQPSGDNNNTAPTQPSGDDVSRAIADERSRVAEIRRIGSTHNIDDARVETWIANGTASDAVRTEALGILGERSQGQTVQRVSVVEESLDRTRNAISRSLSVRFGLPVEESVAQYTGGPVAVRDIMAELAIARGAPASVRYLGVDDLMRGAEFAHMRGDFSVLLESQVSRTLRRAHDEEETTFQHWTVPGTLPDFRSSKRIQMSGARTYLPKAELQPISQSTLATSSEDIALSTFANKFSLTREALINDDLNAFNRLVGLFGRAAARTVNHLVYDHLTGTVTMAEDGQALFSGNAARLSGPNVGGGEALTDAGLALGRKLMRKQRGLPISDANGDKIASQEILNYRPQYLIVPAELENDADKIVNGTFFPAAVSDQTSSFVRSLTPIAEGYLDTKTNGTTDWYLAASPSTVDTIEVARLQGQSGPQFVREQDNELLAFTWISYFDVGIRAMDHRGLYRNRA